MKRFILLLFAIVSLNLSLWAGGGMWIPLLLESLNEGEMREMGMRISAEEIFSLNQSSMKDAIVKFGGGCTGEIISGEGLLLTNHHCGFSYIQKHSSLETNYLKNGFWAMSKSEEIPNPGLSVTFIVSMEDVTEKILDGINEQTSYGERELKIEERIKKLEKESVEGTHYEAEIKAFYQGNEFYLIKKEIFTDVRLVGAPPLAVGKFGGETDNWVWPRHNADFSLFRVYSGPDGKPAEYSEENIPLKPKYFLPISLKGAQKNDFTMVYGFPARTNEYLPSYALDYYLNVQDPLAVNLREKRLDVMRREMRMDEGVRLMYANKESRVANAYKKWKGRMRGLKRNDALGKKQAFEEEFMKRVSENEEWNEAYGNILPEYKKLYQEFAPASVQVHYFFEGGIGMEVMVMANRLRRTLSNAENSEEPEEDIKEFADWALRYHKSYLTSIDRDVAESLMKAYAEEMPEELQPAIIKKLQSDYNGDWKRFTDELFANSILTDTIRLKKAAKKVKIENWQNDPALTLYEGLLVGYIEALPLYQGVEARLENLHRIYMKAITEVFPEERFYPDANFTLRVAYGKVEGMQPLDGVSYKHYTTLDGIMQKYIPGDYEFDLPERMLDLYKKKDYGPYAQDGELRVAFIASNHTSGGNSGSPVINGDGQLIGLNFDRNWEGTMSDFNYDINQCRNISVDIRYILFIVDKYAGASYLIDEMKLIK